MVARHDALFELAFAEEVLPLLDRVGHMPLPPYIDRPDEGSRTVSVIRPCTPRRLGAVAALTAGSHFDQPLLEAIAAKGVETAFVTLHVGAGTFPAGARGAHRRPPHAQRMAGSEPGSGRCRGGLSRACAGGWWRWGPPACAPWKKRRPRWRAQAVQWRHRYLYLPGPAVSCGRCPGHTTFILPESTLLMLLSAFAGYPEAMAAYKAAVLSMDTAFSATVMRCSSPARARATRTRGNSTESHLVACPSSCSPPMARLVAVVLTFPRGTVETPAFMPVGTYGTVKGMLPQ